jgi:hypothetical protein
MTLMGLACFGVGFDVKVRKMGLDGWTCGGAGLGNRVDMSLGFEALLQSGRGGYELGMSLE